MPVKYDEETPVFGCATAVLVTRGNSLAFSAKMRPIGKLDQTGSTIF
jgi:hypothetical protein